MSDYDEAREWMDVSRFDFASETDGSLWIKNLWLAVNAAVPGKDTKVQWFDKTTLQRFSKERATEVGVIFELPGIKSLRARSFQSVTALSPSSIDYYYSSVWPPLIEDGARVEDTDVTPFDEQTDAFNKRRAFAGIDLDHSDERILADFKEWLAVTRDKLHCQAPSVIKPSYLKSLKNHQVLPYIWLWAWQLKNKKKLKYTEIAHIIFPDDRYSLDINDKLKDSTRPLAEDLAHIVDGELNMNRPGFLKLQRCGATHKGIKQS